VLSADDPGLRDTHELAGVELHEARWAGLDTSGLRIDEALLVRCDLSGASLADPELTDAVLDDPNLANAVIRGGSLRRVLVSGGRLTGAQWAETRIHDTVWRNAAADLSAFRLSQLVRVTFDSCNLREADFTGASCSWVRFHDSRRRGSRTPSCGAAGSRRSRVSPAWRACQWSSTRCWASLRSWRTRSASTCSTTDAR
jgi:uncharacterized protein YjbI with pentapeptide repeats